MDRAPIRVDLGDGYTTIVERWGNAGPLLLCVHGISSSRKSWSRTAERFAGTYRVVAYDQRGHGDSYAADGPMTLDRCVADLEAVVRAIREEPFALIGHSWGGAVAIKAGRRVAARKVIAVDPMVHQAPGAWAADFVDDLVPVLAIPPVARVDAIREMFAALPRAEIDAKVHAMRDMTIDPIVALGADNGADEGKWDLREDLRSYPKPMLIMLADPSESVVFPEDLTFIRQNGGPNVALEVFEGEGHTLQRTAFERFAKSVQAYLAL